MTSTDCPVRAAAWTAHAQNNLNQAEQLYRQLLDADQPADLRDAINLGALLRQQGRLGEAVKHYDQWLGCFPDALQLLLNGINAALDLQDSERAMRWVAGMKHWPSNPQPISMPRLWPLMGVWRSPPVTGKAPQPVQTKPESGLIWG